MVMNFKTAETREQLIFQMININNPKIKYNTDLVT